MLSTIARTVLKPRATLHLRSLSTNPAVINAVEFIDSWREADSYDFRGASFSTSKYYGDDKWHCELKLTHGTWSPPRKSFSPITTKSFNGQGETSLEAMDKLRVSLRC